MENLGNLSLFSLGIAIAAIGILGFIVFFSNRRSITNQTFLLFSILTILWSAFNFSTSQPFSSSVSALWFLRFSVFFATWHAFSFFQLFYVFPHEKVKFSKKYLFVLFPLVTLTSLLTLTPLVFSGIGEFSQETGIVRAINGPGIILFGIVTTGLILGGLFLLLKRILKAPKVEKQQFRYILFGSIITFFSLIVFNLILPAFFDNALFIPFAPLFFVPFILFTAYSIIRYHLLNIKVIATEVLVFVLTIVLLFEILFAQDLTILLFRISTFLAALGLGILLIRGVRMEVRQREELQHAYAKLKQLDEAKSEFVSIASHQLRTPLTAIKGYISMILEGTYGKLSVKQQKPVLYIYESNERLITLVNDLLNISRIESGRVKMEWEKTKLEDVIQGAIDELKIRAKKRKLKIIFEKPELPLPSFQMDPAKLRNSILNILDNAMKYTLKGSITITLSPKPANRSLETETVLISVKDTGEGMTTEELSHLFESFSRGKTGTKMWTEGAGLGLYIAKQFIAMHKGKIWAESQGKGKGSTFFIELPVS